MLHRLLSVQRHPPGYGRVLCLYCHLAHTDISVHLLRVCPVFFLHYLSAACQLLRHPLVFPINLGTFAVTPTQLVGLTWDVLAIPRPPWARATPHQLVLNLTGTVKVANPNPKRPLLLAAQQAEVATARHEALAPTSPPLRLALSEAPSLRVASQAPVPSPVHVHDESTTLSLSDSVVLGWLLRWCHSWQLSTGAAPCIPLPPLVPPGISMAWVVCALGADPRDASRMAS